MALIALVLLAQGARAAGTDRSYVVAGKDSFSIGAGDIRSEVSYAGKQTLSLRRRGKTTRYEARVTYTRSDGAASSDAKGAYVADVLPSGDTLDSADRDPDYLTVLNQPFAARLDPQTLKDLQPSARRAAVRLSDTLYGLVASRISRNISAAGCSDRVTPSACASKPRGR